MNMYVHVRVCTCTCMYMYVHGVAMIDLMSYGLFRHDTVGGLEANNEILFITKNSNFTCVLLHSNLFILFYGNKFDS